MIISFIKKGRLNRNKETLFKNMGREIKKTTLMGRFVKETDGFGRLIFQRDVDAPGERAKAGRQKSAGIHIGCCKVLRPKLNEGTR